MKAQHMTHDELLNAARCMERYGGSFAEAIAVAFYKADAYNTQRLVDGFPELFERYYNFGKETS
jgi:predicted nucleic acid-binding protein